MKSTGPVGRASGPWTLSPGFPQTAWGTQPADLAGQALTLSCSVGPPGPVRGAGAAAVGPGASTCPHMPVRSARLAGTRREGPSGETPTSPTPCWGVSGPPDSVGASSGEPGSPQQAWQVCGFGEARPCHLAAPTLSTGARGAEGPPPSLPALPSGSGIGQCVLRPGGLSDLSCHRWVHLPASGLG